MDLRQIHGEDVFSPSPRRLWTSPGTKTRCALS